MKKLSILLLLSFMHNAIMQANKEQSIIQIDRTEPQYTSTNENDIYINDHLIFLAKQWLSHDATPEQKSLIVHMRITLQNKKVFILKGHDLEVFNTFPGDIKAYLKYTFEHICGDGVRDCNSLPSHYQKPVGFHRYLFKPTEEELENFNNDSYWENK